MKTFQFKFSCPMFIIFNTIYLVRLFIILLSLLLFLIILNYINSTFVGKELMFITLEKIVQVLKVVHFDDTENFRKSMLILL